MDGGWQEDKCKEIQNIKESKLGKCKQNGESDHLGLVNISVLQLDQMVEGSNKRDGIYRASIICRNLWSENSLAHFITH